MLQNILLITDGLVHPPLAGRLAVHRALRKMQGFAFQHISSLEALASLRLEGFQAMVLYIHHETISDGALRALDSFVSTGGGVLAIHSATASFKTCPHYFEILGGRFTGHGPVESIDVHPVSTTNPPFDGVGTFQVRDELYLHELQPGIKVHFQTVYQGQPVPVVWTYRYGRGRVCYAVPGHTVESMRHPVVQEILQRGLAWASEQAEINL